MIIVDTNVISEVLRPQANPTVIEWLDAQPSRDLYLTSINAAELWAGVALLPSGRRRDLLVSSLDGLLERLFGQRILDFNNQAAKTFAEMASRTTAIGRPLPLADALIAAIARVHGFAVATRDVGPFAAAGLRVIDPWDPA